ncbi:DUF4123 domain-containing protein [Photobacterium nomapromontoriensis]|uniref:DUF4123 domain-containing protein n=1 Tax=Photobacterium nomapromontoriensis TaxID=2910237 RepID=UPI003D1169AA
MNSQNIQYVLLIDSHRVPDAAYLAVKNEHICGALYQNTQWEPQMDNSPVWLMVKPEDEVWQLWQTDSLWASSGVIFEYDATISQEEIIISLQRHITVYSEDGRLFVLRFYSPYTLTKILKNLQGHLITALLGKACAVSISACLFSLYGYTKINNPKIISEDSQFELPNEFIKELYQ